jgi:hypothetical protein
MDNHKGAIYNWMNRMREILIPILLLSITIGSAQEKKPLVNDDIIQMVKASFSEETIIKTIETSPCNFDTSVQGLLALKFGGVSEKIINAMLTAGNRKDQGAGGTSTSASSAGSKEVPEEVGVYLKKDDKLIEVLPEIVNWKTGGFLKSVATAGLTKGHVNGTVKNPRSPLRINAPVQFIIRCTEGTSAAEYQLLKLDEKGDRREFRAMTGGIIHASGGADKNAVEFKFEKFAPATFRITVENLGNGEYGFLPPGISSASVAASGKIYSFGIGGKQ